MTDAEKKAQHIGFIKWGLVLLGISVTVIAVVLLIILL